MHKTPSLSTCVSDRNGSPVEDKPVGFDVTGWLRKEAGDIAVDPGDAVDSTSDDNACLECKIKEFRECNTPYGKETSLFGIVILDSMRHVNSFSRLVKGPSVLNGKCKAHSNTLATGRSESCNRIEMQVSVTEPYWNHEAEECSYFPFQRFATMGVKVGVAAITVDCVGSGNGRYSNLSAELLSLMRGNST